MRGASQRVLLFYGVGQTGMNNSRTIVMVLLLGKMYRYEKVNQLDLKSGGCVVVLAVGGFYTDCGPAHRYWNMWRGPVDRNTKSLQISNKT